MALPLNNTFEGGSDETILTAANSGGASGDAFNTVFNGAVPRLVFDTAKSVSGGYSLRLDNDAVGGATIATWTSASVGGPFTETWGQTYIWLDAHNSQRFLLVEDGGSAGVRLDILSSGKLRILDSAGASTDSTVNVPTGGWARVEFHAIHSATVGQVDVKFFNGHETTPIESFSTPATRNTRASVNQMTIGQFLTTAVAFSSWLDDVQFNNTGWPGPSGSSSLASDTPFPPLGRGATW